MGRWMKGSAKVARDVTLLLQNICMSCTGLMHYEVCVCVCVCVCVSVSVECIVPGASWTPHMLAVFFLWREFIGRIPNWCTIFSKHQPETKVWRHIGGSMLQCVAVCCSACCSVLQHVAVCCSKPETKVWWHIGFPTVFSKCGAPLRNSVIYLVPKGYD